MTARGRSLGHRSGQRLSDFEQDPFGQFMANHPRGSILTGTVREVDAKGVTVDIEDGIEGYLRANDIAKERVDDATLHFRAGGTVDA